MWSGEFVAPAGTAEAEDIMLVAMASERRPGKPHNEDHVGVVPPLALVLDGASLPPGMDPCCDRTASWYVGRLAAELVVALAKGHEDGLAETLAMAIDTVATDHASTCDRAAKHEAAGPTATVALVRQRCDQLDYLLLGDSILLVETDQGVSYHSDQRIRAVAPEVNARLRSRLRAGFGYGDEAFQALLLEQVRWELAARNRPNGYWIAGHDPAAALHSLTGTVAVGSEAGQVRRAALLTDGLERAVSVFGLYPSWTALLAGLVADGPAACIQRVRAAEAADPDGRHHPREYVSDDASGVVITFDVPSGSSM
jgi:hypothetical protein